MRSDVIPAFSISAFQRAMKGLAVMRLRML